jgi:hypothetical protein
MAMNREELRDEVRANIKRTTEGVADTRINRWLNWAKDYLADLHTYEEMRKTDDTLVTVAHDNSLAWPTRMKDLYSLKLVDGSNSRTLVYVHPRNFDENIPRPATYSEGHPDWYVDYGSTFELFKIPDAIYSMTGRFSQYPSDFANDSATSDLLRKDALICAIATTFGFWSLREIEDATYWGRELVPPLYDASLTSDHSAEDWKPIARGFGGPSNTSILGDWWKSPFVGRGV